MFERALITVPDAPAIPGLAFRRFRGEADYPVIVAILNACDAADGIDYVSTLEEIEHLFAHIRNRDPERDMLFAEVDGETVAFSRVSWSEQGTGERLYKSYGFVHPDWRRRNPFGALRLYQSVGYREVGRFMLFNKEMHLQGA